MGIVQTEIKNLHNLSGDPLEYRVKSKEVTRALINVNDIYTVMTKKTTFNEIQTGTGKMFCGMNNNGDPCIWLFSQKSYAMAYAEHFKFKINQYHLVRKVDRVELATLVYNAMFKGVKTVRIDEGQTYLNVSIYDFVNSLFEADGRDPIIKEEEKPCFNTFNNLKFKGTIAYVYQNEEASVEDVQNLDFMPKVEDGTVKLFLNKEEAIAYAGVAQTQLLSLNYIGVNRLVSKWASKESIQTLQFVSKDQVANMNIKKAAMILNKMA